MALSFFQTNGDGVTTNFAIPFKYLFKQHIRVFVDTIETAGFSWINDATIQVIPAPPSGTLNVEVRRFTPKTPLVSFNNGSTLDQQTLNLITLQAIFIEQERDELPVSLFPSGHTLDSHSDATLGESTTKGTLRVYGTDGKTHGITFSDGGLFQGDTSQSLGVKFLPLGNNNMSLETDHSVAGKLAWRQSLRNTLQSPGDLLVASSAGVGVRHPIGTNNKILVCDDLTQPTRIKWTSDLSNVSISSLTASGVTLNSPTTINTPTINTPTVSGGSFTSPTISGAALSSGSFSGTWSGNVIGTNCLKTAFGSTSGSMASNGTTAVNIDAPDWSFPANFRRTGGTSGSWTGVFNVKFRDHGNYHNNDDYLQRWRLELSVTGTPGGIYSVNYTVQWRYFTASDNPVIWLAIDQSTGNLISVWSGDDPLKNDTPGVGVEGALIQRITSQDLEQLTPLNNKASEAAEHIRSQGLRMQHHAYRAMQFLSGNPAPSEWIVNHCEWDLLTKKLKMKT